MDFRDRVFCGRKTQEEYGDGENPGRAQAGRGRRGTV